MPKGAYKHRRHTEEAKRKISLATRGKKNPFWGKKHTPETLAKISGENANNWKGDKVTYGIVHHRIMRKGGRPRFCEHCKSTKKKKYEWASKDHKYSLDIKDWLRLCTSCHLKYDYKMGLRLPKAK